MTHSDIDECENHNCDECINSVGSYECKCPMNQRDMVMYGKVKCYGNLFIIYLLTSKTKYKYKIIQLRSIF